MNNEEKILELLEQMNHRMEKMDNRMEQMDNRMEQMDNRMEQMDNRLIKVEVTQETMVLPQLELLAEGHTAIQQQIRDISVIDRMQDDIFTLKAAVRQLTTELDRLKSAM